MILKGNQRSGGRQLAAHLLNIKDNEHVHVHELRGFVSDDLHGAFQEAHAASKGTRAKTYLFSLSLNPPPKERVSTEAFLSAIDRAESDLGLVGQPRAVVFHEKDGRRHAHAVWSRIDTRSMKAIDLALYKRKLNDVARALYLQNGWQLPRGFISSKERSPFNYTRDEWQQAQRAGHDPDALKRMFAECWGSADSGKAFAAALKARGYTLARGDRRGIVAVDYKGKVYAVSKYAGVRTRLVKSRLGDSTNLPTVDEARRANAARMSETLKRHVEEAEAQSRQRSASLKFQYTQTIQRQREEREALCRSLEKRWTAENAARAARISKGFRGIWERITGMHREVQSRNEREALLSLHRDRKETDLLIFRHLEERERLQQRIKDERRSAALEIALLHADIARTLEGRGPINLRGDFSKATNQQKDMRRDRWQRPSRGHDFEPEI